MIKKLIKLKKFGIFDNWSWNSDVPEFRRFNLIYGWNRSGKTTLSRVFYACEKQTTILKRYPKGGEFQIKEDNNSVADHANIADKQLSIKVFNKDFVDENISFEPSDTCNPIIYVSEEDIESKKRLDKLRQDTVELNRNVNSAQEEKSNKEEIKNTFLRSLGVEISNALFDKTYNKTKAEKDISKIGVDNFNNKKISDEDKKKFEEISKSEAKKKLNDPSEYKFNFSFGDKNVSNYDDISSIIKHLLEKKVVSETLDRLKNDNDLNSWVERGFDLHKAKEEKNKCLFCQKPLDYDFLDTLSKHFSKDYEDLQNEITAFISKLKSLKRESVATQDNGLYPDLIKHYHEQTKALNNIIDDLNEWFDGAIAKLQEKFKSPLSEVALPEEPKDFKILYNDVIAELKKIIKKHNEKVDNHGEEVKKAKEKLKHNLIAIAIDEQNYKDIEQNLKDADAAEKVAKEKLALNSSQIKTLEQKTSNIGKAVQKINKHLEEFFGRKEIQLELDHVQKGYVVKRDGQFAHNLSEGEKTAIAFSYFIAKVREKDFKTKDGIIFIDDPISSFDSNFIYHCFSLIKNHFSESGQLFISTHNFELFNLIKDWFIKKNINAKKKAKDDPCEFYMIENTIKDSKRCANIVALEGTLKNFKSEYHFLFSLLIKFVDKEIPEYDEYYTIANIARRFIEIFTNFKIPNTGDLASKIQALKIDTSKISKIEQDKVYKLIQEFSHGSDPTSTIEHKDKSESKDAVKILLNMVEESDPIHFELLKKQI